MSSADASGIEAFTLVSILALALASRLSYRAFCWRISMPTS